MSDDDKKNCSLLIQENLSYEFITSKEDTLVKNLVDEMKQKNCPIAIIISNDEIFIGYSSLDDLEKILRTEEDKNISLCKILNRISRKNISSNLDLNKTLEIFQTTNSEWVPVVKNGTTKGIISKTNFINSLEKKLSYLSNLQKKINGMKNQFSELIHDIRTPLSINEAYCILISKSENLSTSEKAKMNKAINASKNVNNYIKEILSLAKQGNLSQININDHSINSIVNTVISNTSVLASNKEIIVEFRSLKLINASVDKTALERALTNLIVNAIKFTPEKGSISLSIDNSTKKDLIITVKDSGIGVPKELIEEIFERFYTKNIIGNNNDGFGIGLSIATKFIELMGGKLSIENNEGAGSIFKLIIPRCIKEILNKKDSIPSAPRLLIVEDDRDLIDYLSFVFEQHGMEVEFASNGKEAEAALQNKYDLILSDIKMPNLNGIELLKIAKTKYKDTPFIFMSGHIDEYQEEINNLEFSADQTIAKPLELSKLLGEVKKLLKVS